MSALQAQSQTDTTKTFVPVDTMIKQATPLRDSAAVKAVTKEHSPRKAAIRSAILPGWGQIYNKKYWKLPLVYGGFIALGYAINFYQTGYIKYKNELFTNLDMGLDQDSDIRPGDVYTTSTYRTVVDQYRRQRDFMIVITGGVYILQMVDALVDAHLKEFDLNPSLKVSWHPSVEQNALIGRTSGVTLVVKF